MRAQGSLQEERSRWILAAVFVHAFQVFLLAISVLAVVGIAHANPPLSGANLIMTISLLVVMLGIIYWFATYLGMIPWVYRTRYRLRRYEEATAQRGATVAMRSQDLVLKFRPRAFGYTWANHGVTLTPAEALRLPTRPDRWTRPVSTRRSFPFL